MGLLVSGLGTILGAVNMITTIVCLRAPGMTMFRMPIFTWNIFITSVLILLAFPLLTAALFALLYDRRPRWQHLRPREWRSPAVAAPVLVLRPPRGLHHRAALLRYRLGDISGLQPQTDLRLQRAWFYATLGIAALSIAVWGASHVRDGARFSCRTSRS